MNDMVVELIKQVILDARLMSAAKSQKTAPRRSGASVRDASSSLSSLLHVRDENVQATGHSMSEK